MTITVFFMILAVVLFIEGIIGMYFIDYLNNKDAAFIGGIFIAGSLIFFMMSIFYPKNCIIPPGAARSGSNYLRTSRYS